MSVRRRLIAGNWKMNGGMASAQKLADSIRVEGAGTGGALQPPEVVLCPSFPYLALVAERLTGRPISLGGQDCSPFATGAHTGDVSPVMLADVGCRYVILGHSERRTDHGETSSLVQAKMTAAHTVGLSVILCVGESLAERQEGRAEAVVATQLKGSLADTAGPQNTVIAYEPVWAIGTGQIASNSDIAAMHSTIRQWLSDRLEPVDAVRLLYGGSVKPTGAAELLQIPNVDGALVGGASLDADAFSAIIAHAYRYAS